ncbi:type II secretion system protein GspK [Undibacterium sp. RTI2.1]|uniref:type II secretion system protein GspK n=1 Tax=unclassified Undibacterium TaxID=2630295 RepID=UPI002AB45190|nr:MULTISPECIES: type II secretion system protein GspK [unclassified Undibacterium]MDY7539953.1 type II secretion system protein GspK [Undibacterium sp. 5I1]MEB0032810.1 type II secretion system protein GspK [Undibacterium sp. RTI2.1]MEB0116464.1 type II secretion system protein GspK [Undibacterium sp. RTI2.2]MEB0230560.1 type II secretion system protein GspK [Undibacterium sp. 10I3]MEB0257258.1 type II secretion system protein GspK [Undibacterium sp. 5I1]
MKRQNGFVLVATLWILATITIAAAYFAQRIANSIELAQQYDQHIKSRIACSDSKSEITYLMSTRNFSLFGLGDVNTHFSLDNRPYKMEGDCIARLQDTRGLYPINGISREALGILLTERKVPVAAYDQLYDTLMDYIAPNPQLHRLNGVTLQDYQNAGLPKPFGRPLITPDQLRNVYGWSAQKSLWEGDTPFTDSITTALNVGMNPNTAPISVLMTLPGITLPGAELIVKYRAIELIQGETQLAQLAGLDPQKLVLKILALPSDTTRVSLGTSSQATSIRYNIKLTPDASEAPWRIDYYYSISQRITQKNDDAIPSNPFELEKAPPPPAKAALNF